ncbi:MAG TPA: galactosyltransferase-related protein [Phycisphaerales bacterium]|nr:galactosyltransferase-related protein [Phycisphaerales bacterium]
MPAPLALVISTHTTRHLARTLAGAAALRPRPGHVVVTCDSDSSELGELIAATAREHSLPVLRVMRPHQRAFRLAQVRNNAVRALRALAGPLPPETRLWFLDGDCCPCPGSARAHLEAGARAGLVIAHRIDLTPAQTEAFDAAALARGRPPVEPAPAQWRALRRRDRRYRRALWLRRLGLAKPHKPKPLGANHSVRLDALVAINGFDEEFEFYGCEDDDLGRRLYASGCRAAIAVAAAPVLHQWHPTSAPPAWSASRGAELLRAPRPARCRLGLDCPAPQPEPSVVACS